MRSLREARAAIGGIGPFSYIDLCNACGLPRTISMRELLQTIESRQGIEQRYRDTGGPSGPLGMPMGGYRNFDGGTIRPFAGGPIRALHHGGIHGPGPTWCAQVTYLGFRCLEESNEGSASDEPYFLISAMGTNGQRTRLIGPTDDVDAGEDHVEIVTVASFDDNLVPPLILGVIGKEHDWGSPEEAAANARKIAESVVSKAEEALSTFSIAAADDHVIPEWFRDILVGWIPEGIAAIAGLGDDNMGGNGRILFAYDPSGMDWASPDPLGKFGENPYNVMMPVGVDPSQGRYELYFNVQVGRKSIVVS